eukprot:CAMPEP_0116874660 /NCGR_PEP_ID=MMETSP0463-20121206/6176_1 /TAXON_ID=181622 /ORGANISM="Strombidinopsis sp, Strain SopsisLIS2011" /LENGTH=108 /DNA_ID=CAMNT_0004518635 /DNA_START=688 /DNA_END=1014 /DNA_ORIENTATION=-
MRHKIPRTTQFLILCLTSFTLEIVAAFTKLTSNVSRSFGVKIQLTNQVVLHVTNDQTVLILAVGVVRHSLGMIKLCFFESPFFVAHISSSYDLQAFMSLTVNDDKSVV